MNTFVLFDEMSIQDLFGFVAKVAGSLIINSTVSAYVLYYTYYGVVGWMGSTGLGAIAFLHSVACLTLHFSTLVLIGCLGSMALMSLGKMAMNFFSPKKEAICA